MPRIPLNPSQVVAQPVGARQAPEGAFGGQTARALSGLGATGQNIAADMQSEAMRAQREEQRKAEEAKRAADAAKSFAVVAGAEDSLTDLHDRISTGLKDGSVARDKAEETYRTEAGKLLDGASKELPETIDRQMTVERLKRSADRLSNGVRRAVTQRDKQEVTTSMQTTLEYAQRLYRSDPAKADAIAKGIVEQYGPHSDLAPDQVSKLYQGWKETTQFTAGYEAVSKAARSNNKKGLTEAEKFIEALPDIDQQRRAVLIDRISMQRNRIDQEAEASARRVDAERDRVLRRAEHEFKAFQALADKGTALDPAYLDQALKSTAGTPYASAIRGLADQAKTTGGLAAQPLTKQQAMLDGINAEIAKNGRSPQLDARKEQVEKVLKGSRADLENDPLRAGLERGVITELKPLNLAGGIAALGPQLRERMEDAERVSAWAGKVVSPLTAQEAQTFKQQLDALPAKERATAISTLGQTMGSRAAQGMAAQLEKMTSGAALPERAFGYAMAMQDTQTTNGRLRSELVLKGADAMRNGTSSKLETATNPVAPSKWQSILMNRLEGFPDERSRKQIAEAATLIAHGMAAEGTPMDGGELDRALRLAVGGTFVDRGIEVTKEGKRTRAMIPLPAGKTEDDLDKALRSVKPQALGKEVLAGGQPIAAEDFVRDVLPNAPLAPVSPGVFAPLVNGRSVLQADGKRVLIRVE
ncbi:MAG: hypothetical protein ACRCV9_02530 [Burkholderiaceae bacterium]